MSSHSSDDDFEDAEEIYLDPIEPMGKNYEESKDLYTIPESPEPSIVSSDDEEFLKAQEDVDELMYQIRDLDTGEMIDMRETNSANFVDRMASITKEDITEIEPFVRSMSSKNELLWTAAEMGDVQTIMDLLDKEMQHGARAAINSRGLDGMTALHLAVAKDHVKAVDALIQNGKNIDIEAKTNIQRTPLHVACSHGHLLSCQSLINFGANMHVPDEDGDTPLHYLAYRGFNNILSWTLEKNPDFTIKNSRGLTPMDVAHDTATMDVISQYMNEKEISSQGISSYGRIQLNRVVIHNSREDQIARMLNRVGAAEGPPDPKAIKAFYEKPAPPVEEEPEPKPTKIGPSDVEIVSMLGSGSFGEVFLVKLKDSQRLYAMKTLKKSQIIGKNLIKYALTERNVLNYSNHPFIVSLHYAFQTPEKLFLVMDYCPGGDMGDMLAKIRKFTETHAKIYLAEIVLAIQYLHAKNIIFRDLKPDNILFDEDGHALITDFGLSKQVEDQNILTRSFCGSVAYLAPEMLRRAGHNKSIDWYLVGVLTYEMLTGRPPFFNTNREQMFENIQRGKLRIPNSLSLEARGFLKDLLHRDPNKRLGSGKEDAEALKRHPFFAEIDWNRALNRELKPTKSAVNKPGKTRVNPDKVFGKLDVSDSRNVMGWSLIGEQELHK